MTRLIEHTSIWRRILVSLFVLLQRANGIIKKQSFHPQFIISSTNLTITNLTSAKPLSSMHQIKKLKPTTKKMHILINCCNHQTHSIPLLKHSYTSQSGKSSPSYSGCGTLHSSYHQTSRWHTARGSTAPHIYTCSRTHCSLVRQP